MNNSPSTNWASVLSAMFLVAGCSIGGGMLVMPITCGASGFFPSLFAMIFVWAAMTTTALLIFEALLWMDEGATIFSLAKKYFGPFGKWLCSALFLYISYASVIAYSAGGGVQVANSFHYLFGMSVSEDFGCAFLAALLTVVITLGGRFVGKVNSLLFFSLVVSYVLLVLLGAREVRPGMLMQMQWGRTYLSIPLLLTAFSFQTLVPSLSLILKREASAVRTAIIGGNTIALIVYAIWEGLILGIVPLEGSHGLLEAAMQSTPITLVIKEHISSSWMIWVAEYFGFFAIVTSFLGMGLGLFDFLADSLSWKKSGGHCFLLGILIAVPSIYIATQYEQVFLYAMDTSGGYGDTLLNGMIPVAIVWIGRYKFQEKGWRMPGGKPLLAFTFIFFALSFGLEFFQQMGWISSITDYTSIPDSLHLREIID